MHIYVYKHIPPKTYIDIDVGYVYVCIYVYVILSVASGRSSAVARGPGGRSLPRAECAREPYIYILIIYIYINIYIYIYICYMYVYIYIYYCMISLSLYLYIYIYIYNSTTIRQQCNKLIITHTFSRTEGVPHTLGCLERFGPKFWGFQGYGSSVLRIICRVPRMCVCVVFSRSAVLRIEGCLNSTLQQYSRNPLKSKNTHTA